MTIKEAMRILGVENLILPEVKAAFRKLAKIKHPDVGGSDAEFMVIAEAYDLIVNQCKLENVWGKPRQEKAVRGIPIYSYREGDLILLTFGQFYALTRGNAVYAEINGLVQLLLPEILNKLVIVTTDIDCMCFDKNNHCLKVNKLAVRMVIMERCGEFIVTLRVPKGTKRVVVSAFGIDTSYKLSWWSRWKKAIQTVKLRNGGLTIQWKFKEV